MMGLAGRIDSGGSRGMRVECIWSCDCMMKKCGGASSAYDLQRR